MNITTLTKDRIILTHMGKDIRIEGQKNGNINFYISPETKLALPRSKIVGKRKIVIKA